MKTIVTIIAACVAFTFSQAQQAGDIARFERWMARVYQEAQKQGLELEPGNEAEQEWFYLYYWQSNKYSVARAVRQTKKAWSNEGRPKQEMTTWIFHYVYNRGPKQGTIGMTSASAYQFKAALSKVKRDIPDATITKATRSPIRTR